MNDSTTANINGMLGDAAMNFLTNLVNAKKNGEQLPKALDKVASVVIQGETKAIEIAKDEATEQATKKMAWVIVGILSIVIVFLLMKNN